MSAGSDPDRARADLRAYWDRASVGWERNAERVRDSGIAVSMWMIDHLDLQPGQRVLELAAGPGDTGFLAAELIRPGGILISSDGSEAMLDVARARARTLGIDNVEFKTLELEWIDMPAASVDAILCRWGFMLVLDPATALRESRRVLRPGGKLALAVWDVPDGNPWVRIPSRALIEAGHMEPPEPSGPGMFALSEPGKLEALLEDAGFTEVHLEAVDVTRSYEDVERYLEEVRGLSVQVTDIWEGLDEHERTRLRDRVAELAEPFTGADGRLTLPGSSLAAAAEA